MEINLYAAARAAIGTSERVLQRADSATIGDVLSELSAEQDAPTAERTAKVFASCSFLVNGVASTDSGRALHDGDRLDVLPPFAGG